MEILAASAAEYIRTVFVTPAVNTVLASKHFSTRNPPYVQIVSSATIPTPPAASGFPLSSLDLHLEKPRSCALWVAVLAEASSRT
jgi:hypothetical protein